MSLEHVMELLIAGCAGFLLIHLGISGTPLRGVAQNMLGEGGYLGVYSVLSLAALILMIYGYNQVPHAEFIWYPSAIAYKFTKVLVLLALLLLVMGSLVKNPTAVASEDALDNEISGMLKVTRHPVQWAILLFAIGHIIANGDVASLLMFGTLATLSLLGMFSMDARRRKEEDPRWQVFMEKTSMVPFAALIAGRLKFTMADLNWTGLVAGAGLYAAAYWLHDMISGGVSLF
jgi:uncharacterized membrane protein